MRSITRKSLRWVFLTMPCVLTVQAVAQQSGDAAAPAVPGGTTPSPAANTPPPPGEDVMHPTERGVRLTPAMARAFSRLSVAEMRDEYKTTPEQEQKLTDAFATRFMQTARKYEEQGQNFSEALVETMWKSMGNGKGLEFTPESGRELGNRALPAIPAIRELMEGMVTDAEPILSPQATEALRQKIGEGLKEMDKFEAKMKRWSQGDLKPGENPFNDRGETTTQPAGDTNGANSATPKKSTSPQVERAEREADSLLSFTGTAEWTMFKGQVESYFKFDDQQKAQAEQILTGYRAKADAIMTPEWKSAMRQNRVKVNLRSQIKGVPTAPWFWRLEHEYAQGTRPVQELGWAFKKEILALISRAQREAALGELSARATENGMTLDDKDQAVLGLSGSSWNFWKF